MSKSLIAALLILFGMIVIVGCNVSDPAPFDPRAVGDGDRLASRDVRTYAMQPLPTTLQSPYLEDEAEHPTTTPTTGPSLGTEPQVRLTLQEIVHRAVANSNDIKVAAYQPAIDQTRVVAEEARFDPTFFWNAQVQRIDKELAFAVAGASQATGNPDDTGGVVQQETDYSVSVGIRQETESGGTIEFRNDSQIQSNPLLKGLSNFNHDPAIDNEFVLQVTQPLLRDFGVDVNRARIVINRNNQRISLLDFRKQIEDTLSDIEKTYWELVQAEEVVKIQEDLLSQTIDTAQRLVQRVGTDVTKVQILQTDAQLETRRSNLIQAKSHVKDLSAQLKRDMNDPDFPISGPIIIMPASLPLTEMVQFNQQDVINTAFANRLELGEQQLRIDSATTAQMVGKNQLLPQLNAAGSIDLQGLGGNFPSAFEDQYNRDYVSWSFGLQFEVPIGNRAARATYDRSILQRMQAITSYAAAQGTVTFDCDTAMRGVQSSWDSLGADKQSVIAAAKALEGYQQREAAGEALTPEFIQVKLQFQDTLADSRRAEAQSLAAYNQAIAKLEQAKGTLLQYENVILQEDAIPYDRKRLWQAK